MNIWVAPTNAISQAQPVTRLGGRPPGWHGWSTDGRFVLFLKDENGDENYSLYAIDPPRRHPETSEPIPCPSLRAKRSNPGAAVRPSGLLAPRMLRPLDCFVARAPRNDGWVAADPIDSVVIGSRPTAKFAI